MKKWLKERFPLNAFNYEVPEHANTLPFFLGGITMINFVVLIISGIILAQFYNGSPETANQSIRFLMTEVPLGNLVRGFHYWSAQLAMIFLLVHLFRVFIYGSYKKPREGNWLIGVGLFVLMFGLYYTGTILKWDQEAVEALDHTLAAVEMLGPLGFYFSPEFAPQLSILGKILTLHISVLPIITVIVIVIHLYLIKMLKISDLPYRSKNQVSSKKIQPKKTFVDHFKVLFAYGLINIGVLGVLATFFPAGLGGVPVSGIESTKPPWLFMGVFSIENWTGLAGLIWTSLAAVVLLIIIPFIDRSSSPDWKQRKVFVISGLIAFVVFTGLTLNGYLTKPEQHIGMGSEMEETESTKTVVKTDGEKDSSEMVGQDDLKETSPEVQALQAALTIINDMKTLVKNENYSEALAKAKELDKTVDAVGDKIKAKDSALRQRMAEAIHELGEITPNGNNSGVINNLQIAEETIRDAIQLFQPKEVNDGSKIETPETAALKTALEQVAELKEAVTAKNVSKAIKLAKAIDKSVDEIGEKIEAKDKSLRQNLGEDIHELEEISNSNISDPKLQERLNRIEENLTTAVELFKTP